MASKSKKRILRSTSLPNPTSTSGTGYRFEHRVQAFFIIQMMINGYLPKMPPVQIDKIAFQSSDFETDDCIIYATDQNNLSRKILIQSKYNIEISNSNFKDVIKDAWTDYNNKDFSTERDKIFLITGNLHKCDDAITKVLDYIHGPSTYGDFSTHYFPKQACKKYEKIKEYAEQACNRILSPEEFFNFMKIFYILKTDLHEDTMESADINLSLLHTCLKKENYAKNPNEIFQGLIILLDKQNRNAYTLCRDHLPAEIEELFIKESTIDKPKKLTTRDIESQKQNDGYIQTDLKRELALLSIIGQFDDSNKNDLLMVEKIMDESYDQLIQKGIILDPNIQHVDHIVKVRHVKPIFQALGKYIIEYDLDKFEEAFTTILNETDPALDLPFNQRCLKNLYDKNRKYSETLRQGITNGMAMLTNNADLCTSCSQPNINTMIAMATQKIFQNNNLKFWLSNYDLLSVISEIDSPKFLDAYEQTFTHLDDKLLKELNCDNNDFLGIDYEQSLVRALCNVSWDQDLFIRSCLNLAKLANAELLNHNSNSYPLNALVAILVPWKPQTLASSEKQYQAVKQIATQYPKIGRHLLIQLLPNITNTVGSIATPVWKTTSYGNHIDDSSVAYEQYWKQEDLYAQLLIDMSDSTDDLIEVVEYISHLTKNSLQLLLNKIDATIKGISDKDKIQLWNALQKIDLNDLPKNKLTTSQIKSFKDVLNKLSPKDPIIRYAYLFNHYDHELVNNATNYRDGVKQLRQNQEQAIKEVLDSKGVTGIIRLIEEAKFTDQIGSLLGKQSNSKIDKQLLPKYLKDTRKYISFYKAYMAARTSTLKLAEWCKDLEINSWNNDQLLEFFLCLPFRQETWTLLEQHNDIQEKYWANVQDLRETFYQPYDAQPIKKLLSAKRPVEAVICLNYYMQSQKFAENVQKIDYQLCREALLESTKKFNEFINSNNPGTIRYNLANAIRFVQDRTTYPDPVLQGIEWFYLPLLRHDSFIPRAIIYGIENNPEYFCQILQEYTNLDGIQDSEPLYDNLLVLTEPEHTSYKILPGLEQNGNFNEAHFKKWITEVQKMCSTKKLADLAQRTIGRYFIYAPADPESGLWVHPSIAAILDQENAEKIRQSYNIGIINSRGIYHVDPTGKPEYELHAKWSKRAEAIEEAGFITFATSLRKLAKYFQNEAHRRIALAKDIPH